MPFIDDKKYLDTDGLAYFWEKIKQYVLNAFNFANIVNGLGYTPPRADTHYTTNLYAGSGTAANAATTNGNTKLTVADNTTARKSVTLKGTGATTVTSDANGTITINSTNTTYSAGTGISISSGAISTKKVTVKEITRKNITIDANSYVIINIASGLSTANLATVLSVTPFTVGNSNCLPSNCYMNGATAIVYASNVGSVQATGITVGARIHYYA